MEDLVNKNYKEKYEAVLNRVKDYFEGKTKLYSNVDETLKYLFPELKESEDEMIRKEIIQSIQDNMCVIHKDKCIAWLEKQKEANNKTEIFKKLLELFVKITSFTVAPWFNKESFQIMKEDFSNINETLHLFTIEELKSFFSLLENTRNERIQYIENEKSLQCIECMLKRKDEQKPAWSEEDVKCYNTICFILHDLEVTSEDKKLAENWLKSLKERMKGE